jgi:peroxiredoxin Q/BCP
MVRPQFKEASMIRKISFLIAVGFISLTLNTFAFAAADVGAAAPQFKTKTSTNEEFSLDSRKGKWTVLYFYPKAETPGCTKQACSFRDTVKLIRELNAEVYGVSTDTPEALASFAKHHNLNFPLLSDTDAKISEQYGAKMKDIEVKGVKVKEMKMANRYTFIIGPDLKIKYVDKQVDPVKDAENVSKKIKELQKKS